MLQKRGKFTRRRRSCVVQLAATALNDEENKDEDIMETIIHHIGEMGTYQRWLVVIILPFGAFIAFNYALQMFIAATPQEHWCRVPELQNLTVELRRNLSIPLSEKSPGWDRCTMYDTNYTQVLATLTPPANNTPVIPCRDGWEFLFEDIPYSTVISEREWVCERAGYAPTAQALFFIGSLVGVAIFGWIGDAYGRLPAFVGANLIGFIGSMSTIFTVGWWDFALSRFVAGLASDSGYVMIYIIILEFIGSRHRTWVSNFAMAVSCSGALMLTPLLALWLKNWKTLVIVTTAPALLALAGPWIVPESARWLASSGQVDRALAVLKKFERINKRKIPEDVINEFIMTSNKKRVTDESFPALLQSKKLRNCLLAIIFVSIVSNMGLDTIIRLSENIGSNFFVIFAASSFMELPALALVTVTLDRFGRRAVLVATLALGSVFSFICAFISRGFTQAVLAVTIRFFLNMAISAAIQLAPEVLPTPVRSTGNSLIHLLTFLGITLSPYIVFSATVWVPLPLIIIGVICVLGIFVSLLLPETKGRPMPQTIADGERLVAANMLCGKAEVDDEADELPTLKLKS